MNRTKGTEHLLENRQRRKRTRERRSNSMKRSNSILAGNGSAIAAQKSETGVQRTVHWIEYRVHDRGSLRVRRLIFTYSGFLKPTFLFKTL